MLHAGCLQQEAERDDEGLAFSLLIYSKRYVTARVLKRAEMVALQLPRMEHCFNGGLYSMRSTKPNKVTARRQALCGKEFVAGRPRD